MAVVFSKQGKRIETKASTLPTELTYGISNFPDSAQCFSTTFQFCYKITYRLYS